MADRFLYIFLDEAGNLDFSPSGTRYFLLGAVTKERPFNAYKELTDLKYDLAERGLDLEYFHAAEDNQITRNRVFEVIHRHLGGIKIDALIAEKHKTVLGLRVEHHFYPRMLGLLLRRILCQYELDAYREVIVFTDSLPVQKHRASMEKAVKTTLATILPPSARYRLLHHASKSNIDLQIADYCTWAIYRKWNLGDQRSYQHIKAAVSSETEIFHEETSY